MIEELGRRLPPTLLLMGLGMTVGVTLGIFFGIVAAVKRYTLLDNTLTFLAFLGISTPAFLAGLLGMYVFALKLGWFPAGGYQTPGDGGVLDILRHLILPAMILSVTYIAISDALHPFQHSGSAVSGLRSHRLGQGRVRRTG